MAEAEAPDEAKLELGRTVFLERAQPACGICHTLADAGTEGAIGPVLDDLRPTVEVVTRAVTQGIGPMRPYTDLSEEEIDALAHYVAHVTGAE
ncbi:cytochrome c [Arsenicitalea aurantiaca]|uniref:Cytochrome c n=2 Tax=Arsenicitalea aurantiaca TaxID=1783274 RepID=A0A433XGN8_9HYPH|nr:cytochrome c [Arsenicitalea aurantiaca]